jgi:predicted metal-binding membrane protein
MYAATVRRVPVAIYAAIALAWLVAIAAQITGGSELVHHDFLIEGGLPPVVALVLFVAAWQLMIVAMMLPSSLPMIRLYWSAARSQDRPRAALGMFLGGYALVWIGFGIVALAGDLILHRAVESWEWLGARPHIISGGVLVMAGAFQFSKLKDRCLTECRHPGIYLMRHYRRGVEEAFRLGSGHGLFCLGCCWALMFVMFAAGVANIVWMAALAAVMVYEKIGRRGRALTPAVGVALIAMGLLALMLGSGPGVS